VASLKLLALIPAPVTGDVLQKLLDDALYTGLRQLRVKGAEYQQFIDEFMQAAVSQYVTVSVVTAALRSIYVSIMLVLWWPSNAILVTGWRECEFNSWCSLVDVNVKVPFSALTLLIMVALCNKADHYIFALWFLSFFLSSFFPRLISAAIDWMSIILPHIVWP